MNPPNQSISTFRNCRWVICGLLFFATTCNYLDRQVISLLKSYVFCAPKETAADFSVLTPNDLDLHIFVGELNQSQDAVSLFIKTNLSAGTLAALNGYPRDPSLETNLITDLNALIANGRIYSADRFAGVKLRPETQKLLASPPRAGGVAHLNRLLLDDKYPRGLSRGGFGWSNGDFSNLTSFFTGIYAGFTIIAGWFIDRIGTKLGLALSLIVWSIFGIANAFVGSLITAHIAIRSLFATGEAGNFPASIKTVAEWFPKRERALATAIFNAGSNSGAMIAAFFVPLCLIIFGNDLGWKMAFILTGVIGFPWLIFWFWLYHPPNKHPRLSKAEYDYIHVDDETAIDQQVGDKTAKVSWWKLFGYRQLWSFFAGKLMTDGIWWFYLFWLPDYLDKQFHMTKSQIILPTFMVYGVAIVGSIFGGSIPMMLIKRGMGVYQARMTTMFLIALLPLAVLLTQYFGNVSRFGGMAAILAVATICIGATAHQAWSANLFTTVSDMFPKKAVASVTGIGTAAGGIGGVAVQKLSGALNDYYQATPQTAYLIMFIICAFSYLIAWAIMKALVPRHKPIIDL
ncbi:MAG: MFS transporter [Limisphaerales bacterium]